MWLGICAALTPSGSRFFHRENINWNNQRQKLQKARFEIIINLSRQEIAVAAQSSGLKLFRWNDIKIGIWVQFCYNKDENVRILTLTISSKTCLTQGLVSRKAWRIRVRICFSFWHVKFRLKLIYWNGEAVALII